MTVHYPRDVICDLIDGRLPWEQTRQIMSGYKDADRFGTVIGLLEERVPWDDRILLPISEHLFIVERDDRGIVKCSCGHEFCDFRENWKLEALVIARSDAASLEEIYGHAGPDPGWQEVREFVCPGCGTLLEVDVAAPGSPIPFDFRPDLVAFYRDWLGTPLSPTFQG
jgi:acetone carboxylase gamma subunit